MRSNLGRRCAALALVTALAAPLAGAAPLGGVGEVWGWL